MNSGYFTDRHCHLPDQRLFKNQSWTERVTQKPMRPGQLDLSQLQPIWSPATGLAWTAVLPTPTHWKTASTERHLYI